MYANASACCRKLKSLSFIKGLANQPWCNHRIHLLVSVHWAINLLSVSVHRGNAELYCRSGMVISCKQDKRYDADSALPTIMLWRGCHDSGRSVNTITVWGVSSLDITRVDDITPVMTPAQPRGARGHTAAQHLPPRSLRNAERGDVLALLPGRPIAADICVTHPLAASADIAAARDMGATAKGKETLKRGKYSRTGTGACRFIPLSHETFGRAGPAAFALLSEVAEFAAGSGVVSKRNSWRTPCATCS